MSSPHGCPHVRALPRRMTVRPQDDGRSQRCWTTRPAFCRRHENRPPRMTCRSQVMSHDASHLTCISQVMFRVGHAGRAPFSAARFGRACRSSRPWGGARRACCCRLPQPTRSPGGEFQQLKRLSSTTRRRRRRLSKEVRHSVAWVALCPLQRLKGQRLMRSSVAFSERESLQVNGVLVRSQRLKRLSGGVYEDIPVRACASYIGSFSRFGRCIGWRISCGLQFFQTVSVSDRRPVSSWRRFWVAGSGQLVSSSTRLDETFACVPRPHRPRSLLCVRR